MKNNYIKILFSFIFLLSFFQSNANFDFIKKEFYKPLKENITAPKSNATLTITDVSDNAGNSIVVPVQISNATDLAGFQWTIKYDDTKLSFVNCTNWDPNLIGSVTINSSTSGKITFVYSEANGVNISSGTFFELNFNILSGATGVAALIWSDNPTARYVNDSAPNEIITTWNNGSISIYNSGINPTLTIKEVYGIAGSAVTVPVTAYNLSGLTGFQFTIDYDQTKLTYVNCTNWDADVTGTVTINDNGDVLTFAYNDYPNEINIADGKFFDINFTVNGSTSGIAPVIWSDNPTARELSNAVPEVIPANWKDGKVTITAAANPILTIEKVNGTAGSPVTVPVNAFNLNGLVGFQWTINYDQTKLSYVSCSNWDTDVSASITINDNTTNGTLSFAYNDYPNEINIADGKFFDINFTVLAGASGVAPVIWSDNPTARELSDATPAVITASWADGQVFLNYSWVGSTSTDWQTTSNWTPEQIPKLADDIIIPDGMPNYPVIDDGTTTAVCKNMTIEANANVTIATNGQMTVSGSITNNRGAAGLIVKSDATGTGSLIVNNAVAATTERFVTGNQWHLMFPTLSAIPTSTYTTEGSDINNNFYSYNEPNEDYWNTTTIYGTSGWTSEVSATNIRTDKGYLFNRYNMGDKTFVQTGGNLEASDKIFNVSNTVSSIVIGNGVTQGREYFDGWNLAGNPFTSAIDWNSVTYNGVENGIYYYNGTNYSYYIPGGGTTSWDIGTSVNNGSQYIPSGQGFMVKVANTGSTHSTTFTVPASARMHNTQSYWKNVVSVPNLLKFNIEKDAYTDEAIVRTLPEGATEGHDAKYDAYKMFSWDNTKPQIYSLNNDLTLSQAINSLPEISKNKVIPLGIYIGKAGEYTINNLENNFEGFTVFLHDILTDTYTEMVTSASYTFNSEPGTYNNRMELVFEKSNSNINKTDEHNVLLFPNPNKGSFYLSVNNITDNYRVEITTVTGQVIYQNKFYEKGTNEIKINTVSNGIYFVKVIFNNNRTVTKKMVVE